MWCKIFKCHANISAFMQPPFNIWFSADQERQLFEFVVPIIYCKGFLSKEVSLTNTDSGCTKFLFDRSVIPNLLFLHLEVLILLTKK